MDNGKTSELKREVAKVTDTFFGLDDGRWFALRLTLDYGGAGQCFTSPVLAAREPKEKETGAAMDFVRRILMLFDVDKLDAIKGRYCYALKLNEFGLVLGLATLEPDGERTFIAEDWRREWFGETTKG